MASELPPLDYFTPPPKQRWSWRKRIWWTLAVLLGIVVLFYCGGLVVFVTTNLDR